MRKKLFFFVGLFIVVMSAQGMAMSMEICDTAFCSATLSLPDTIIDEAIVCPADSLPAKKADIKKEKRKRVMTAVAAFPFPFGFVGAHRVMLGTAPWVPVVYVATFGGCFGLLPLIDFFVITFSKDLSEYENNPHIFMWVK